MNEASNRPGMWSLLTKGPGRDPACSPSRTVIDYQNQSTPTPTPSPTPPPYHRTPEEAAALDAQIAQGLEANRRAMSPEELEEAINAGGRAGTLLREWRDNHNQLPAYSPPGFPPGVNPSPPPYEQGPPPDYEAVPTRRGPASGTMWEQIMKAIGR